MSLSYFSFLERNIAVVNAVIYTISRKLAYLLGLIRREGILTKRSSPLRVGNIFKGNKAGVLPSSNSSFLLLLYGRIDVTLKSTTLLLTYTL